MLYLIVLGDVVVMGFMTALVIWLFLGQDKEKQEQVRQIPLQDEVRDE